MTNNVIRETYTCMGYAIQKSITSGHCWHVMSGPNFRDIIASTSSKKDAFDHVRELRANEYAELKPEIAYLLKEYLGMLETSDAPHALGRMKRVNAVLEKLGW